MKWEQTKFASHPPRFVGKLQAKLSLSPLLPHGSAGLGEKNQRDGKCRKTLLRAADENRIKMNDSAGWVFRSVSAVCICLANKPERIKWENLFIVIKLVIVNCDDERFSIKKYESLAALRVFLVFNVGCERELFAREFFGRQRWLRVKEGEAKVEFRATLGIINHRREISSIACAAVHLTLFFYFARWIFHYMISRIHFWALSHCCILFIHCKKKCARL